MKRVSITLFLIAFLTFPLYSQYTTIFYSGVNASWMNYGKDVYQTDIPGLSIVDDNNSQLKVGGDFGFRSQLFLTRKILFQTGAGLSFRGFDDYFVNGNTEYDLRVGLRYVDVPLMIGTLKFIDEYTGDMMTFAAGIQYSRLLSSRIATSPVGGPWEEFDYNPELFFSSNDIALIASVTFQAGRIYLETSGGMGLISPLLENSNAKPVFLQLRMGLGLF